MDYSVCNQDALHEHLCSHLPEGALSAEYQGVYYEEAEMEEKFRDELDTFIYECNRARTGSDGYELCEDCDPRIGVVTFYIMREDGMSMAECAVYFIDADSGVRLHSKI